MPISEVLFHVLCCPFFIWIVSIGGIFLGIGDMFTRRAWRRLAFIAAAIFVFLLFTQFLSYVPVPYPDWLIIPAFLCFIAWQALPWFMIIPAIVAILKSDLDYSEATARFAGWVSGQK